MRIVEEIPHPGNETEHQRKRKKQYTQQGFHVN
jgi:hypothetical protein